MSIGGPHVGAPRWSPDGGRVAFFATTGAEGRFLSYVVGAEVGLPQRLGRDGLEEAKPTWSRDGRWIYFTSGRSGSLQIWKVPADGGRPVQITKGAGAEASESPDGRLLYYAKVSEEGPGLWTVPAEGGDEIRVLDSVWCCNWAMAQQGIYFVDFSVGDDAPRPVRFFHFQTRRVGRIGAVEKSVSWRAMLPVFAVSPDGRWLLYSNIENTAADLMLVDHFR